MDLAFRRKPREVMPGDVSDDLENQPGREWRAGVVELGREVLDASLAGVRRTA
jgi:hypothetical protein